MRVLSLRTWILAGFGVTLALLALVLAWGVVNLVSLGAASDAILRENYRSILAAESMVGALERQASGVLVAELGERERGERLVRDGHTEFVRWLSRAQDNITIDGEAELVARIDAAHRRFVAAAQELVAAAPTGSGTAAYRERAEPAFGEVHAAALALRDLNQATMQAASHSASLVARRAIASTAGVGLAALIGGLAFAVYLSGRIVRPVRNVIDAARAIGEGNYDVRVPRTGVAELGSLAAEFNGMAVKLGAFHRMNIGRIVAEKHKSEAILRGIDDGVVVVDADGKVIDINRAAAEMLQVEPARATGRSLVELLPDTEVHQRVLETARTGSAPAVVEDARIISVQGGSRHASWSITPIRSEEGGLTGVVLLLRDVTRLKELDRLKSDFVMAASHELRTPLTSIAMSVGLLREQTGAQLTEQQRELLDAAHEETQRLRALVSDLLDLSRIEAGRIELTPKAVAVGVLVDRVEGVMRAQLLDKRVHFHTDVPADLPEVAVDPHKITWVLTNLVGNALRYVQPGGHIRVVARRARGHVRVAVQDDGRGIPAAYQSRIFDKFVRVEGSEAPGGSGLGLTICKEIVRAHGGTIWVDSSPGHGATFTFTLPAADAEPGAADDDNEETMA